MSCSSGMCSRAANSCACLSTGSGIWASMVFMSFLFLQFQQHLRRSDGLDSETLHSCKVSQIMPHNVAGIGSDGEFQDEIVVRIVQPGPPAETDGVLLPAGSQEVQDIFN